MKKIRLDAYLAEQENISRTKAKQLIEDERVLLNSILCTKPATEVKKDDVIVITNIFKYASLGGYKLEKALNDFSFNVNNLICLDVGASNGGFTDCLLKMGAKKVYALDVGECMLPDYLVNDSRVVVKERINARNIVSKDFVDIIDFICVDCSFISLKLLLEPVYNVLKENGICIALIKPQFECGKKALSKSGIVLSDKTRLKAIENIKNFAISIGFSYLNITNAPIKKDKNIEYLIMFKK